MPPSTTNCPLNVVNLAPIWASRQGDSRILSRFSGVTRGNVTIRGVGCVVMQLSALLSDEGKPLIQAVVQHAKVPVIETGAGNCHVFVDQTADFAMAREIAFNAKVSAAF